MARPLLEMTQCSHNRVSHALTEFHRIHLSQKCMIPSIATGKELHLFLMEHKL